jgi:hypothetical protein
MYDTSIYAERLIAGSDLVRVFARATRTATESVAAVDSPELDGAVEEWGMPDKLTVLRYWSIPGEFPFAADILFKDASVATEDDVLAVLHEAAADLNVPLLSVETDVFAAFRVIFPDGSEAIVDEDPIVPDPSIVLTDASRRAYDSRRSRYPRSALTAE